MKTKGGQIMKNIIKILSVLPIISLSACSVYKTLSNEQTIIRANEIIEQQNSGAVTFNAFTYSGRYVASFSGESEMLENATRKLVRDYQNPYLYSYSNYQYDNETYSTELWIYRTEGNVICAYSDTSENTKVYTAYPLSQENIFASLIEETKTLTDITYVEELTYSQVSLRRIEEFYTQPEPREIYQGYSFVARSKGPGSLDATSSFAYMDNEETIAVSEELSIVNYLFSSLKIVQSVTEINDSGIYETLVLRQTEAISYQAKLVYPDLNNFTFIENL